MKAVDPRLSRQDELLVIPGPAGALEVVVTRPALAAPDVAALATADEDRVARRPGLVVIGHPHPQMGGSLHNKVVQTLARAARDLNLVAVRFNFRGVEGSEGVFDDGNGETDDFLAVYRWAVSSFPCERTVVAGFSFGSYVAARAFHRLRASNAAPHGVILVAPPVGRMSFDDLPLCDAPCHVIQGEMDEVVDPNAVFAWQAARTDIPDAALWRLPAADHFFHGKLGPLKHAVSGVLEQLLAVEIAPGVRP